MGKMMTSAILVMVAIGVLVVAYFALRAVSSFRQGYSCQEMDWSQRGNTSIEDFFAASDIGKREVIQRGGKCIEYYAYKDGLTTKTVCQK